MCKTGQSWVGNGQGLANNAINQLMGNGQYMNNMAANNPKQPEPSIVERGYLDNLPPPVDPAVELAEFIANQPIFDVKTFAISADGLRSLIRNHWSKVSALAHQIHEEGR